MSPKEIHNVVKTTAEGWYLGKHSYFTAENTGFLMVN